MRNITNTFTIPLILAVAFLGLAAAIAKFYVAPPHWLIPATVVSALALIAWAARLALRGSAGQGGGRGGQAKAIGDNSDAAGGRGGNAGKTSGGDGGSATAKGRGSKARGGDGGHG